jgi:hypothetical protein
MRRRPLVDCREHRVNCTASLTCADTHPPRRSVSLYTQPNSDTDNYVKGFLLERRAFVVTVNILYVCELLCSPRLESPIVTKNVCPKTRWYRIVFYLTNTRGFSHMVHFQCHVVFRSDFVFAHYRLRGDTSEPRSQTPCGLNPCT